MQNRRPSDWGEIKMDVISQTLANDKDAALALALALAITSSDETKFAQCVAMAETIANSGMTLARVLAAKERAQKIVDGGFPSV